MNKSLFVVCAATIGALALSSPVFAQQKTEKACKEEWRANKAENQAAKITEKAYVEKCRGAAVKPETAKTPAATAPAQAPAPAASKSAPAKPATAASTGANQFTTDALAKAHCPTDTVV